MKVKDLKAELKALGLSTKGKKAELEARLAEALAEDQEEATIEEEVVEEVVEEELEEATVEEEEVVEEETLETTTCNCRTPEGFRKNPRCSPGYGCLA